jgi:CheY-like chemotaxis protein
LKTVLVVEDNADLRELFAEALELDGYTVATAAGPDEALRELQTVRPCVILLDLVMPGTGGGSDLYTELRANPALATIPVLLVSGAADLPQRAAELGAQGYLTKPVDTDRLLDAVRRYCR